MPRESPFAFQAEIWLVPGKGGWHFVTVPEPLSKRIKAAFGSFDQGWGSLPARASIGSIHWKTSLFPDAKSGCYLLPVKAAVRKRAGLSAGDSVRIQLGIAPAES